MKKNNIAKSFTKKFVLNRKYQLLAEDFVTDESHVELVFRDTYKDEIVFIPIRIVKKREYLAKEDIEAYLEDRKIIRTMKWFLTKHDLLSEEVRVDLAEVSIHGKKAALRYSMKVIY